MFFFENRTDGDIKKLVWVELETNFECIIYSGA